MVQWYLLGGAKGDPNGLKPRCRCSVRGMLGHSRNLRVELSGNPLSKEPAKAMKHPTAKSSENGQRCTCVRKTSCAETVGSTHWKRCGAFSWKEFALRIATDWVTRPVLTQFFACCYGSQCTVGPVQTQQLLPHGKVVDVSIALIELAAKNCEERGDQRHH